ncbi:MAG: caspase family protein [Alphaproteobacteria bacterium]|jgi:hypothetical protein|nr:caspase family protein [Alphaproteobacteria bacterium]
MRFLYLLLVAACFYLLSGATASARQCGEIGESKPLTIPVKYENSTSDEILYTGSYALILSASNYASPWSVLEEVATEADDIANVLVSQGFRVHVFCDPTASGKGSLAEVQNFVTRYGVGKNRILIVMSGHGWVYQPTRSGYFAAIDSPGEGDKARAWGLSSDAIIQTVKDSKALHTLVIVDACYSAAIFTQKSTTEIKGASSLVDFEDLKRPTRQFITAGRENERTPSPSIFSPAFILGISGYADLNNDGVVRASELGIWLRDKVANNTDRQTSPLMGFIPSEKDRRGNPVMVMDGGDFIFKYADRPQHEIFENIRSRGKIYLQNLNEPIEIVTNTWPDKRYKVTYYEKQGDHGLVKEALESSKIPFLATASFLDTNRPTNGLACHPDAPPEVVKAAAKALIEGGVKLRIIDHATKNLQARRYDVQALHFAALATPAYRDLTIDDLDRFDRCPLEFAFKRL